MPLKKSRKKKSATPHSDKSGTENEAWLDPGSKEFAFRVAHLAWYEGLTANAIVTKMGLQKKSLSLMQVKRALRRAHGEFIRLIPPSQQRLESELNARFDGRTQFYIVDDQNVQGGLVSAKAAEVVSGFVEELIVKTSGSGNSGHTDQVLPVVCNAGGNAVWGMVNAMQRQVSSFADDPDKEDDKPPCFVAGNSAYLPDRFDRSASFLSVTLAGLYRAPSLAMPAPADPNRNETHREHVKRCQLFICGAGSCGSTENSGLMMSQLRQHGLEVPKDAVGDLSFNLLNKYGDLVDLCDDGKKVMKNLNPTLDLATIHSIGKSGRVLLILESSDPRSKLDIAIATLIGNYATDVVMGARFAEIVLKELDKRI